MIAMARSTKPKRLTAEPTTALDVTIQAQALDSMKDPAAALGITPGFGVNAH